MKKGLFITFEGIDGCGKSTQTAILKKKLEDSGSRCMLTQEPSSGPIGAMIRQCLTKRISFDERTMACLFAADRIDHLTNETSGILKSVNNGTTVICDRYVLSSFAYQSAGAPLDWVMDLNDQAGDIIRPDLHIYMDIPVEMSLERIDRNRASHELYETRDRLNKVKSNYEHIIEKLTGLGQESIFTVDATLSPDAIADKIWYRVTGLLNNG